MSKIFNMGTIPQTIAHLHNDGYMVSTAAFRHWVRSGQIPANYCGKRAYIWYPKALEFLQNGGPDPVFSDADDQTEGVIRRIG